MKKAEKDKGKYGQKRCWMAFYLPFLWKGKLWGSMPFVQESCGKIRDP